ncbi:efflux RND transporter periplasmic adaptor subunit [Pseudomonas sp. NPDC089752]|uniref:efflux RND transporter periplasmic adaptor subunit n=1 Tax=Pseudomonas sp. NPDC089752 TaxID=3364472 RepID=UPI0038137FAE
MSRRKQWLTVATLVGCLLLTGAMLNREDSDRADEQTIALQARMQPLEQRVVAAGVVQPSLAVEVGSQVSGQVLKLHVRQGDTVKRGDCVAQIDDRIYKARVGASQALIEKLDAQLQEQRFEVQFLNRQVNRLRELVRVEAESKERLESIEFEVLKGNARVRSLQAEIQQNLQILKSEQVNLLNTRILAPIDGVVMAVAVTEGQTLNINQQTPLIMQIADLSAMTVHTRISEVEINDIKVGMTARFSVHGSAGRTWGGAVITIAPSPDLSQPAVHYVATIEADNLDGFLKAGMNADVSIITRPEESRLVLPLAALASYRQRPLDNKRTLVSIRALQDGTVYRHKLVLDHTFEDQAVILEGLRESQVLHALVAQ